MIASPAHDAGNSCLQNDQNVKTQYDAQVKLMKEVNAQKQNRMKEIMTSTGVLSECHEGRLTIRIH